MHHSVHTSSQGLTISNDNIILLLYLYKYHSVHCRNTQPGVSQKWDAHPQPKPLYVWSKTWPTLSKSQSRITVWGVKTPGRCYIIWIIKYPFNPTPKEKNQICHSYDQPISVHPSFVVSLKTNLDTVFIHYRLIVQTAAASSRSEGDEVQGKEVGVQEELPRLSCSAERVKAQ